MMRWLLNVETIPAGSEGLRLAWERPFPGWVWLLLLIGVVAFAFWSYGRLAGNRTGRLILAGARSLVIVLVLILISGPMLQLPRETVERDWLLVLTDRSASMQIGDAPDRGDRIAREEQLRRALERTSTMWRELAEEREVIWLGFHAGAFELSAPDDADQAVLPIEPGQPDGRRTSIGPALEQALQRAAARPISGVVIFSDGRTADPPARSLVRRLQADAIKVITVPLGSDEPLGDLAVRRVDAPRRAFVRDKVPVVVELDRFGEAAARMGGTVRLVDELSGEVLDTVTLDPNDPVDRVTLTAEPMLAGETTWRVEIDADRTDLLGENNIRTFPLELIDRPLRVLYIDGYPRWEYHFLKSLLIREESIESSVMLLSADRDFAQEGNTPISRLPRTAEEFAQFDVMIIGDVPGSFFSPVQLELMRDHVAERGAGLLWIGGERYTPVSYAGTAMSDILPIRGTLALPRMDRPVNMTPTGLSERLGVLQMVTMDGVGWPRELSDPAFGWSRLQWAQRIEPGQLKPTAQPLAVTTTLSGETEHPLVVHMRFGAGQTIYVATDEIWRWRYGRGELLPSQFWVQMIRMLGRESLTGSSDPAVLEIEPRRLAVTQPMQIDLRLLDNRLAALELNTITAQLEAADGTPLGEIDLRSIPGTSGQYAATYFPDQVGQLRVRVTDPLLGGDPLVADVEVFSPDDEFRRPETDHALLATLAEETGGIVLRPDELERLAEPGLLPNRSIRTENPLSERIWDSPLAFLLILLLLTAEWIGRKVIRLA